MAKMEYRVVSIARDGTEIEIKPSVVEVGHEWTARSAVSYIRTARAHRGVEHRVLRRRAGTNSAPWLQYQSCVMSAGDGSISRGDMMTPGQRARLDALDRAGYALEELVMAALETLRELCDDCANSPQSAVLLARYEAARAHAAALVELLPLRG